MRCAHLFELRLCQDDACIRRGAVHQGRGCHAHRQQFQRVTGALLLCLVLRRSCIGGGRCLAQGDAARGGGCWSLLSRGNAAASTHAQTCVVHRLKLSQESSSMREILCPMLTATQLARCTLRSHGAQQCEHLTAHSRRKDPTPGEPHHYSRSAGAGVAFGTPLLACHGRPAAPHKSWTKSPTSSCAPATLSGMTPHL